MSVQPLIGVSTSEVRRRDEHRTVPQGEPPRSELALGERYLEAVRMGGGIPVILAPVRTSAVDTLLDRLDALCLSGGPDLHPHHYGAPEHPELGPTEPELDQFELALARRAIARGLPVLAICRGLQVMNVARGGTLQQHLPDLGQDVLHRQSLTEGTSHPIELLADSRLAKLIGSTRFEVNSYHHQAIDQLGDGLRVVGHAPDGVPEAIEGMTNGFVFGVQWHAEALAERPDQLALFEGLVRAGSERSQRSPEAA
ncbi:MAG: gamma-glutamyl-gamma-aminobutyrate hydrolase family protein [Thermoleophilaceae bacterium]